MMLSRASKIRFRDENQTTEDALKDVLARPAKRAKLPAATAATAVDGATKKRAALGDLSNTTSSLLQGLYGTTVKKAALAEPTASSLKASTASSSAATKTIVLSDKENATAAAPKAKLAVAVPAAADKERSLRSTVAGLTSSLAKSSAALLRPTAAAPSTTTASAALAARMTSSRTVAGPAATSTAGSRVILKAKRSIASSSSISSSTSSSTTIAKPSSKSQLEIPGSQKMPIEISQDEMEVVLDKSKEDMSEAESDDEAALTSSSNKTVIHRSVPSSDNQPEEDEEDEEAAAPEVAAAPRPPRLSTTHLLSNIFAGVDLEEVEDIDADDRDDPLQCIHLVEDIFAVMREKELKDRPNLNYMAHQQSINAKMRGILVDWMVDVGSTFTLLSETVFLAVRLLDMFLSKKQVSRERMQLVGVAALVIASKFEEVRSPFIEDWIWISDDAYTRDEILRMETIMLGVLNYNMGTPTPLHFLRRFSKAAKSDSRTHTLSKYLTELSMPEYTMLRFPPSMVAAAAVYLARKMTAKTPVWNKTLQHYTKYTAAELIPCAQLLNEVHSMGKEGTGVAFAAVKKKYANEGLYAVSKMPAATFD